jgi:hypothetical protein
VRRLQEAQFLYPKEQEDRRTKNGIFEILYVVQKAYKAQGSENYG